MPGADDKNPNGRSNDEKGNRDIRRNRGLCGRSAFWPPLGRSSQNNSDRSNGKVYAVTVQVDPNFPLVWEGGMTTHLGAVPWDVYGGANTIFTWGWTFGGEFYDEENWKVTAAHLGNTEALEWIRGYYERYSSYAGQIGDFPNNTVAMRPAVSANLRS